jgi:predicted SAM-dependent methyltransferase
MSILGQLPLWKPLRKLLGRIRRAGALAGALARSRRHSAAQLQLQRRLAGVAAPRLIIGAADTVQAGWISTDCDTLDLLKPIAWRRFLKPGSVTAMLAEHVWEHLTPRGAAIAARTVYEFLQPGGYIRVAVPDGLHPDPEFRAYVAPPNMGHQVLYTYQSLQQIFTAAGFQVDLLEWFSEEGQFHARDWNVEDGFISRSARFDERNASGVLACTSIILDARKPLA